MSDKLKELYKDIILRHNNNPLNFEKRGDAQYTVEAYNPVCGDAYKLYFDIVDNEIRNITFHGYGCAISKASASIMTKLMENQPLEKVIQTDELFRSIIESDTPVEHLPQELTAFMTVKKHPGRIKCVTLIWDSLKEQLASKT